VPCWPMAAGGMKYGEDRPSLAQRPVGGVRNPSPEAEQPAGDATPCWVNLGDRRVAGTVHGWVRGPDGWQALVVAWLPGDRLGRRD